MPMTASHITRLKEAHARLKTAYVRVHNEAAGQRLVRPIVDDHLRRRTRALHDAYLHAAETEVPEGEDRKWLIDEAEALERLEATFRSRRNVGRLLTSVNFVVGLPGVVSFLSLGGVTAAALALLNQCLCHLVGFVPLVSTLVILLTYWWAFSRKRKLFEAADTGAEGGVYGAEDQVFDVLGIRKEREPAVDLQGWMLITGIWLVASIFEMTASGRLYSSARGPIFWGYFIAALLITVGFYFHSRRRKPA